MLCHYYTTHTQLYGQMVCMYNTIGLKLLFGYRGMRIGVDYVLRMGHFSYQTERVFYTMRYSRTHVFSSRPTMAA